jgi:hypothetical protein
MFQLEHFVRTGLYVRYLGSSEQGARNQPFADGLGVLSSPSATSSSRAFSTGFHSYRARAALDKGGFRYPRSKFVCGAVPNGTRFVFVTLPGTAVPGFHMPPLRG